MILEFEIRREHSKRQALKISRWVDGDKKRFAALMKLFLIADCRIPQRASWIVSLCVEQHPDLATRWLSKMIRKISEENVHNEVTRNVVRILQFVSIPKNLHGKTAHLCFNFLRSVHAPVAVKAYSMTVLANIAAEQPDLKREIALLLEEMLPYGTAGNRARARNVLKQLTQ
jgi:hypothetical protein